MSQPLTLSASDSRRLLLQGCGLLEDPTQTCTPKKLYTAIERLGFVQLDTISIVERAHNHIMWTRFHAFRPLQLDSLQERGKLFEHFTHDASLIPSIWYPHWRHRFERVQWSNWIDSRLSNRKDELLNAVRTRIEKEGPLLARDFEDKEHQRGAWWDWKPAKAALEYLWRTGELTIPRRDKFQKVYDLTHRVMPKEHAAPTPTSQEHIDWACTTAVERLGAATPGEIKQFWNALKPAQVAAWCTQGLKDGRLIEVRIDGAKGSKKGIAFHDIAKALKKLPPAEPVTRLLSPFDPLIRNRERLERLFGFSYRFEAFVPEPKRTHGYYVLPILRGDRLIGRLDPKLDRKTSTLDIRRIWFEPEAAAQDRGSVTHAIEEYAAFCGAKSIKFPRGFSRK